MKTEVTGQYNQANTLTPVPLGDLETAQQRVTVARDREMVVVLAVNAGTAVEPVSSIRVNVLVVQVIHPPAPVAAESKHFDRKCCC